MADDDGFVGAKLERDRQSGDAGFDAAAYSFFGDMAGEDDALEGPLEEGLEGPPEEEAPDPDLLLDEDEDLSYASMFAAALESDRGGMASAAGNQLHPPAGQQQGEPAAAPAATSVAGPSPGGSLFSDFDLSADLRPTPPRAKLGSIALGGLLAAGAPGPGSPFGSAPASSPFGGFGSTPGMPMPPPQPRPSPLSDPAVMHMGPPPPPHMAPSLPAGGLGGPLGPRAMTAQELEAQLLGGGGGAGQQQQQIGGPPMQQPPPPQPHYGAMGMPPPQHNGYPPMQHQMQMQGPPSGYGMPPGGPAGPMHLPPGYGLEPYPAPMQGPPPPPHFSPGAAFPPMSGPERPPPRPIPMQHPGMFGGPPGDMQAAPPPGYGPPPPGMQQQQMGGPTRGPGPGFAPHMRPGPPGMIPPHMRPGPPGPWAQRPPPDMPPPGQPQPQQRHPQHATLAQRLRALNLADRHEEVRRPMLRRRYQSRYMDHEEIEHILAIQWRALHQTTPYLEDYYYQAFLYKYYAKRNRRSFAPESVRELAPTEKTAGDEVAFVRVEGLGRLPFSNIRRPRPLMDIAPGQPRGGTGSEGEGEEGRGEGEGGEGEGSARPLEQEPMLAARIMIEDCMCLILDVLDIDQIFVAAAGGPVEVEGALRTRRSLLLDGLAASLRLPEAAVVAPPTPGAGAGAGEMGDGVFLRLMALTKGKKLLARALRVVYPAPEAVQPRQPRSALVDGQLAGGAPPAPHPPNLRVVWAALRSLRFLFSGRPGGAEDVAACSAAAAAAAEVLRRLHSPRAVADCLAAAVGGDLDGAPLLASQPDAVLMPLFAPGATAHDTQRPWLADVLTALLQRGAELDLLPGAAAPEREAAAAAAWRHHLPALYSLVERHVGALHEAFQAGVAMGEQEAAAEVKALMPISLVRVLLPHCTAQQAGVLRRQLLDLGV
ncbi:expressed protein [Chlorella variabilis]|uniref:Expressed protein n=1 Tax=Chlorella variabilis TaxID=554065 RepID=E1Z5M1_CHLVA|nr:expressed protein [Chlorella variabilis]EFN58497.1 expressed protein [Chlorella variabilis]|eukprot:XP_005850599.1 expressed protein [Chlorella variabilis]